MSAAGERMAFKIVILGEGCVGKTSIVLRYCQNTFVESHVATLQASFLTKKLTVGNRTVDLNVWDTAGQERFHALGPIYYRDANGALLVYDITDADSFLKVKSWTKELRTMLGDEIPIIFAGNKVDLEHKSRNVSLAEAESYAASVGAVVIETSAKLNRNVDTLFLELTKKILENKAKAASAAGPSVGGAGAASRKGLQLANDDEAPKKGNCC